MNDSVRWFSQVLAWLVIGVVAVVLAVAVVIPRLGGATPYTVLTGSMRPGLPPGTLVVSRPVNPQDLVPGQVVTYQLRSGQPAVVTHRIVSVGINAAGEQRFITQGDANDVPDALPVRPEQIRGVEWYAVPVLGRLNQVLTGHQRQLAVYGVAGGLLGYALLMFARAVVGASRRRGPVGVGA